MCETERVMVCVDIIVRMGVCMRICTAYATAFSHNFWHFIEKILGPWRGEFNVESVKAKMDRLNVPRAVAVSAIL